MFLIFVLLFMRLWCYLKYIAVHKYVLILIMCFCYLIMVLYCCLWLSFAQFNVLWTWVFLPIGTHLPYRVTGMGKIIPVDGYGYGWRVRLEETGMGMGWLHPYPYPAGAIPSWNNSVCCFCLCCFAKEDCGLPWGPRIAKLKRGTNGTANGDMAYLPSTAKYFGVSLIFLTNGTARLRLFRRRRLVCRRRVACRPLHLYPSAAIARAPLYCCICI
jgi:hypothetical protein